MLEILYCFVGSAVMLTSELEMPVPHLFQVRSGLSQELKDYSSISLCVSVCLDLVCHKIRNFLNTIQISLTLVINKHAVCNDFYSQGSVDVTAERLGEAGSQGKVHQLRPSKS